MFENFFLAAIADRIGRQQPGVIAAQSRQLGLGSRLRRITTNSGNTDKFSGRFGQLVIERFGNQTQYRFVESMTADGELSGVHTRRDAAGAGVEVIPNESALMLRGKASVTAKC
jgi:hypothetical protein